ncbi:MAG: hypothetical protein KDC95_19725 [Planctomycetes bacterium]|nr:hypothetical protein [Planctomycetota bacterium]
MACNCRELTRGVFVTQVAGAAGGMQAVRIPWAIASRCKQLTVNVAEELGAVDLEDDDDESDTASRIEALAEPSRLIYEKLRVALSDIPVADTSLVGDPIVTDEVLLDIVARKGAMRLCCVEYKVTWAGSGFVPNDIVTLDAFSAGDDKWGPFPGRQANNQGVVPRQVLTGLQVCKEHGDCEKLKVGKLVFQLTRAAAARPLGTIDKIQVCKLQ